MKTVEKIIDLIENSDLKPIEKLRGVGFLKRATEDFKARESDMDLIEGLARRKDVTVVISTDDVKIYKVDNTKDDWDKKYPYRLLYNAGNGEWKSASTVSASVDEAMLTYLNYKYLRSNGNDFVYFAMRMLGMEPTR